MNLHLDFRHFMATGRDAWLVGIIARHPSPWQSGFETAQSREQRDEQSPPTNPDGNNDDSAFVAQGGINTVQRGQVEQL
jgi:hypothetical protein